MSAVPFIILDEKEEEFYVTDEAKAFLETVDAPVSVCSVVGPYRTGKSFVLNQLIGRKGAFQTGSTVNACTKGIWIWTEAITYKADDGVERKMVLIDTEGLGAFDQSKTHDTRVFSLATLLSSYLVFNTMGTIDENAIEQLSFVANLTKHIHLSARDAARANHANDDDDDEDIDDSTFDQYADIFPRFLWLVRDFCLELVDPSGRAITSKEYLEQALCETKGTSVKTMQRNQIRRCLKLFFRMRDCEVIVRPVNDEKDLRHVDTLEENKLRSEFLNQMKSVKGNIFKRTYAKTMYGNILSGSAFCGLAEAYVEAINSGAVPTLSTAWDSVREKECQRAAAAAFELYKSELAKLRPGLPLTHDEILEGHREAKAEANKVFRSGAIGGEVDEYVAELKQKMRAEKTKLFAENVETSKEACEHLLKSEFAPINEKVDAHKYDDVATLMADWKRLEDRYLAAPKLGPARSEVLASFSTSRVQDAVARLVNFFTTEFEKERQALKEKIHEGERQRMNDKMEFQQKVAESEVKLTKLETQSSFLEKEVASYKDRCEQVMKEKAVCEERESALRKDLEAAREKKDKVEKELNEEVEKLRTELKKWKQTDEEKESKLRETANELNTARHHLQEAQKKQKGGCVVM